MVSVSQDLKHSIRSVLNWTDGNQREGWYWRADSDHDTLVSLLNSDSEEAQLAISLDYYSEGVRHSYNLPETTLPAGASYMLDIGQVIASGKPDVDGNTIPASVTYGGYHVRKVGKRLWTTVTAEALVFDHARQNFLTIYNTCCGYEGTSFSPGLFLGPVGPLGSAVIQGQNYCTGQWVDITSGGTFSTANTRVATVNAHRERRIDEYELQDNLSTAKNGRYLHHHKCRQ